jgi:hypothetical protein
LNFLKNNKRDAKQILENSRKLILEKHSNIAWKEYFRKIWQAIENDNFGGCEWRNGNLEIMSKTII